MGYARLREPEHGTKIPTACGGYVRLRENKLYQYWNPNGYEDDEFDVVIMIHKTPYLVNGIDLDYLTNEEVVEYLVDVMALKVEDYFNGPVPITIRGEIYRR